VLHKLVLVFNGRHSLSMTLWRNEHHYLQLCKAKDLRVRRRARCDPDTIRAKIALLRWRMGLFGGLKDA